MILMFITTNPLAMLFLSAEICAISGQDSLPLLLSVAWRRKMLAA